VRRDASGEPVQAPGQLVGIADSGRLAVQFFHPNPLASALDMDFGGQKDPVGNSGLPMPLMETFAGRELCPKQLGTEE
jgi:hypothetical protein